MFTRIYLYHIIADFFFQNQHFGDGIFACNDQARLGGTEICQNVHVCARARLCVYVSRCVCVCVHVRVWIDICV